VRAPRAALPVAMQGVETADAPLKYKDTTPGRPFYATMALLLMAGVIAVTGFSWFSPRTQGVATGDGLIVYGQTANTMPQARTYNGTTNTFAAAAGTTTGGTGNTVVTRTSPTKIEAISGYVNASGTLQIMCYDGISWSNEWSVTVGGTGTTRRFDIAYETNSGDVMVLYSTNTATTNELAYRTKAGSTGCGAANWAATTNISSARTTGIVQWVKLAWDKRAAQNLITAIWADASSSLSSQVWSGTAWGNEPTAALSTTLQTSAAAQDVDDFSVQYESTSGDVMVVWGINVAAGANGVRYATCTGGTSACTWSAVTTPPTWLDDATNLDLSSNPNSDEMVFASIGKNQSDLQIGYWSGTAWTNTGNVDTSANLPAAGQAIVRTGWLTSGATTRSIVVYADATATTTSISYYTGNAGVFTVGTDFVGAPIPGVFRWFNIEQDPLNKDRLMLTYTDATNHLYAKRLIMTAVPAFTWTNADGSAALDSTIPQVTNSDFSFAYWRFIPAPSMNQAAYRWFTNLDADDLTAVTANPSANSDRAHGVAVDGAAQSLFVVGEDRTVSTTDAQWRIEKRSTVDGSLVTTFGTSGVVLSNPSGTADVPNTVALDTSRGYMFVGGYDNTPGNNEWRIEKRDLTTGTVDSGFGTAGVVTENTSTGADFVKQIVTDPTGGYIYLIGDDNTPGNLQWRIEKRLMSTGALVTTFGTGGIVTSNPSANSDEPQDITFDSASGYLYVAGYDAVTSAANTKWRIEKYNAGTGLICSSVGNCAAGVFGTAGVVTSDPSVLAEQANAIRTDGTYIYVGGTDATISLANLQMRFEKYNASTGLICSSVGNCAAGVFGTAGVVQNNPTTLADGITDLNLDTANNDIYASGYENGVTDTKWHTEDRDMTTGALVPAFANAGVAVTNPSSGDDQPEAGAVDSTTAAIYSVGRDFSPGNDEWRIAKRNFTDGSSGFVSALAAANTAATAPPVGTPFRLRLLLHANANDLLLSGTNFKLQVATRSGTCDTAFVGETYADVSPTTGALRYFNNPTPASPGATLADGRDPTDGSFTVLPQTYNEANNFTNSVSAIPIGQDGLWDFSLVDFSSTAGTVYCFRVVDSAGAVIGSYSQIPQITTAAASATPNVPASLSQAKTDNTVLTTGSWTNVTAIKFTANVSDPDASDSLKLCVEKKPVASAFTNTEDACGSAVAYAGSAVPASVTITGIADQTSYHWQARTRDNAGNVSAWVSYGGNSDVVTAATDFALDGTPPTGGTVFDGSSVGVDQTFNSGSLSSVSANWSGVTATLSGLNFYEYSVGSTPGATDLLGWTNNGTATTVTINSLNLRTTQIYYVNVRTNDNAGNTSVISSNGQVVQPSISFALSGSTLNFLNLNGSNSFTDTANTTLTTSTNAYGGYMVRAYLTQLLTSTSTPTTTIPLFSGGTYALPAAWTGTGFGYTSSATTIQGATKFPAAGACLGSGVAPCYAPFTLTAPGDIVADHTANVTGTPITNEQFTITAKVSTATSQSAKKYTTVIVYQAVPIY
jgi:hypothetical protein